MNKFLLRPFLVVLVSLFSHQVNAQALSITSTSSTVSRCPATGSITVNATGGTAPYLYSITAGPILKPDQVPNVLVGLSPGTYTVKVKDNIGASVTQTVTVGGSYTTLNPSSTFTSPYCPGGSDGTITVTIPVATGRAPYGFQLISGPVTTGVITPGTNVYTFTGLSAGVYQYQVSDSCGNFQTRSVTITATAGYGISFLATTYANLVNRSLCDSFMVRLVPNVFTYKPPYTYEVYLNGVVSPATTMTFTSSVIDHNFYFTVPNPTDFCGGKHTYKVTDACGTVSAVFNMKPINPSITGTGRSTCGGNDIDIIMNITAGGTILHPGAMKLPITYTITRTSPTAGAPISQVLNVSHGKVTFVDPGAGTYNIDVTDSCGKTCSYTTTVAPVAKSKTLNNDCAYGRYDSTTFFRFTTSGYYKPQITIFSGPSTYTSLVNGISALPITYPQTILPYTTSAAGVSSYQYTDFPLGVYNMVITDSCGSADTSSFSVTPAMVQKYTFYPPSFIQGCPGASKIKQKSYRSCTIINTSYKTIELFRISPSPASVATFYNTTPLDSNLFTGLVDGTYEIRYNYNAGGVASLIGDPLASVVHRDTIIVGPYSAPTSPSILTIPCPNTTTGSLYATPHNGIAPFQYAIIAGPTTKPDQVDSFFTILPTSSTPYTVRVTDACLNSSTYSATMSAIPNPIITATPPCVTMGSPINIIADSVNATTYSWTGPSSHTGRTFSVASATIADTGTYTLTATTMNCASTSTSTIHLVDCSLYALPLNLLDFGGKIEGDMAHIYWLTTNEREVNHFELERSFDGASWGKIYSVNARNISNSNLEKYAFIDQQVFNRSVLYKLQLFENSGKSFYSPTIQLNLNGKNSVIAIYPNPTKDQINIQIKSTSLHNNYQIIDAIGRVVLTGELQNNGNNKIDVNSIAAGAYIVKVTLDNNVVSTEHIQIIK